MNDKHNEFLHRLYGQLVGGKVVGHRLDADAWNSDEPFPVLIIRTRHGEVLDCTVSCDEEGNGAGFMFVEEHDKNLGGISQK